MRIQVALVDDESSAREYVSRMRIWHEDAFCLAICASGAQELMRKLEHTAIEILLMDVSMPDTDGVTLSAHIKQMYPQIDIIAISNYDDYDYVRQILKNGAKDYLLKHRLTEDVLRTALVRLADQRMHPKSEMESMYRQQLLRFLDGDVSWPFPTDGSISVPCFGFAPTLDNLIEEQRSSVIWGIEKALEYNSDEAVRCTACHYGDGLFLLLLRFYNRNSRAAMEQQAHYLCEKARDHVRSVYSHPLLLEKGPILLDQTTLPDYILHRIHQEKRLNTDAAPVLTSEQRTVLSTLIEQNDQEALQDKVRSALANIGSRDMQTRFFLLRDLMQAARDADAESLVPLPSESELLEWLSTQNWQYVSERTCQVFEALSAAQKQEVSGSYPAAVDDAVAILGREYGRQLTLSNVAARVGVSEAYLSRLFKRELNCSFNRYLTALRMEHAKEMLLRGMPLKEVAAETGYIQYTHFLRVFKQSVGITPKEYIRNSKNR